MKTQLSDLLRLVTGVLVLMGAQVVNAQDLNGITARDVLLKIRTTNVDQMNQIVSKLDRNQMARLIRNIDTQTMNEIVRNLDDGTVTEIARRISIVYPENWTGG